MNCSAKGRRLEYKSMRLFEPAANTCVRSAGSLGPFDFVAVGSIDFILCQDEIKSMAKR